MEYIAGAVLALGVGFLATYARFDRDRAFYPTVLVVSASYYDLFAILGGGGLILGLETLGFCAFVAVAVIGFRTNLWLVVAALLGHGVLDVFHGSLVPNPGVPSWWPAFCLTFDLVAGTYLASRLYLRGAETPARERALAPRPVKTRLAWALVLLIGASAAPAMAAKAEGIRVASLDGRQVAYRVMGSGRPVMVLISGLGDGMASFKDVAPQLAARGTVILYDRAGYGRSAMGPETRDAVSTERELSLLLAHIDIPGPYVLVGHSLGGQFAEYYAARHPDQVAGLVLEESRPPDFTAVCEAAKVGPCAPTAAMMPFAPAGAKAEAAALSATAVQVQAAAAIGGKSVLILSRSAKPETGTFDAVWSSAQAHLEDRYPGARRIEAPTPGHYLHRDAPSWFVDAVREFAGATGDNS